MFKRTAFAAAICVLVLSAVPFALAGKGGGHGGKPGGGGTGSGSGSFSLVNVTGSTDGLVHWGQQITFTVSATVAEPHVSLNCYQGGTLVYTSQTGYYASYPWPWTQIFTLSSGAWTSGPASCTAVLYYFSGTSQTTLSSMNIPVAA